MTARKIELRGSMDALPPVPFRASRKKWTGEQEEFQRSGSEWMGWDNSHR